MTADQISFTRPAFILADQSVRTAPKYSATRTYLLAHAGASIFVAAVCAFAPNDSAGSITAACWLFTACIIWILSSWARISKALFSPYTLFLAAATLFNGGQAILHTLGLMEHGVLGSKFSEATTTATIYYAALSIMLLHLGAVWRLAGRPGDQLSRLSSAATDKLAIRLGIMLVLIAIVPMYLQVRENIATVVQNGYFGLYQREVKVHIDSWQALLSQFMLSGALLLAAASRRQRTTRNLALVIIGLYFLTHAFMGLRGASIAALVAFIWVWHTRVRKIATSTLLLTGAILTFVIFPMLFVFRTATGEDRLNWRTFTRSIEAIDNPAVNAITEMGRSMNTIAYTMELIPSNREFDLGASYFYAGLTAIPNIFGTPLHPSTARGTPSDWLVRTVSYRTAMAGGGLGYSFIAEAYLNFGWLGAPIVMIALGYGLMALQFAACRPGASAGTVALMAIIIYFAVTFARAESASVVRGIVWYGVLPMVALSLFTGSRRATSSRAPRLAYSPVMLQGASPCSPTAPDSSKPSNRS